MMRQKDPNIILLDNIKPETLMALFGVHVDFKGMCEADRVALLLSNPTLYKDHISFDSLKNESQIKIAMKYPSKYAKFIDWTASAATYHTSRLMEDDPKRFVRGEFPIYGYSAARMMDAIRIRPEYLKELSANFTKIKHKAAVRALIARFGASLMRRITNNDAMNCVLTSREMVLLLGSKDIKVRKTLKVLIEQDLTLEVMSGAVKLTPALTKALTKI